MKRVLTIKEKQQLKLQLDEMLKKEPARYGLAVDEFGAVPLEDLALAAAREIPWVQQQHIVAIAGDAHSGLLIEDGLIQFNSGQLYPVVSSKAIQPPQILYLATNPMLVNTWLHSGAMPLLKRFLLLFPTQDEAWHHATAVESVHSPTVITVAALEAYKSGAVFYASDRTYYCRKIPAQFIKI